MDRVPTDVGLAPSDASRDLPLQPPCALGSLPHAGPDRSLPDHRKKSKGGVGERGRGRVGREWLWLEGRVLQLPSEEGGRRKCTFVCDTQVGTTVATNILACISFVLLKLNFGRITIKFVSNNCFWNYFGQCNACT